jgi:ATP-dependent Clp protease ATP-binding subunit ClpB
LRVSLKVFGKTELAKLCEYLFDDDAMMTRIDMSGETLEKHSVTEKRRTPQVMLADEGWAVSEAVKENHIQLFCSIVKKAHPDVYNVFGWWMMEGLPIIRTGE